MIKLFDVASATTLAQVLPVLLLAVMVELRRLELHRRGRSVARTRALLATFFGAFALVETVLVLSTDGHLFPFQWSDLIAAIIIFALLCALFAMSMMSSESRRRRTGAAHVPDASDASDPSDAKQSRASDAGATIAEETKE